MASLVLFVPALHKGYLDLFEQYSDIYLLDDSILKTIPRFKYIERDLRRFDVGVLQKILQGFYSDKKVAIASADTIRNVTDAIEMPSDEISEEVAEKFFKGKTIKFVPIFLRWNKKITQKESEPHPDRIVSTDEFDRELMIKASALTNKSSDWWRQIGAVIVKDGNVVIEAYNKRLPSEYTQDAYGDPRSNFDAGEHIELASTIHAESFAIAQAAKKGLALDGASLYVTTYPCPVCAKSIVMSGVKKLYYRDGYSLFDAEKILKAFDVEIVRVEMS